MEEEEQKISFVTNFKEWDRVYSPRQKTPEQIYEQIELKSSIVEALNHLSERERKVLIMRFGLEDGWDRTLDIRRSRSPANSS
jgi:DNA-directed RNA polymerase sigma subunit (sigma70/sigma32)